MTLAATPSLHGTPVTAAPVVPVLVVGALMTAITMGQTVPDLVRGLPDPDALVRLQQVRDWLSGQAWHDLVQRRLGTPGGVPMHWSRLVDAPIAGLILLFSAFVPRPTAELVALAVWPAVLGIAAMGAVVAIAVRLAGRAAAWPAALMMLFAIHVRYLFSAGNVDHHNVQLVLALWLVAAVIRLEAGRAMGAAAGMIAATMLAIGLETLPLVALAGLAAGLGLALDPARMRAGAGVFGATFAAFAVALDRLAMPPSGPGVLTCDVLSPPYLAAAVIGGGGLAALAWAGGRLPRTAAWAALALIGALAAGAALAIEPRCLRGPYGELDPVLVARWLATVDEAKSWPQLVRDDLGKAIAYMGAPLAGLVIGAVAWRRAPAAERFAWGVVIGAGLLTTLLLMHQIRAASFAAAFALPAGAVLVTRARAAGGQLLLVAAYLLPQGIVYEGIGRAVNAAGLFRSDMQLITSEMVGGPPSPPLTACFDRASFATLAALPPARILAPSNLGPALIVHTPHAALAGPYHRDRAGLLDAMDAFERPEASALEIAQRRGLDLLVWCTGDSVVPGTAFHHPDGLAARLVRGPLPAWLQPVAVDGAIRVYRIERSGGPS